MSENKTALTQSRHHKSTVLVASQALSCGCRTPDPKSECSNGRGETLHSASSRISMYPQSTERKLGADAQNVICADAKIRTA